MTPSDSSDTSRARGKPARGWEDKFFAAFAETGIVLRACKAAQVSRSTVYLHRDKDEAFAERWREAEEESADAAESEAWRRGVEGIDKPVFYKGEQVSVMREYSDRMLELVLKARRPDRFRDNHKHEIGGEATVHFVLSPGEQHGKRDDEG